MQIRYYESNWKAFLVIFIMISCFFGLQEIKTISNHISSGFENVNLEDYNIISSLRQTTKQTLNFTWDATHKAYDIIYLRILNIPLVFWFLVILNIFLMYNLRLENIKDVSMNLLVTYNANKKTDLKTSYTWFRDFISSSYGAISIASISEIIILLKNYNTPGSMFWMCLTIALLGLIQLSEIILNCHYVDNQSKSKSCFICVIQYIANKYLGITKDQKISKRITKLIVLYGVCMGIISFFSATIFQMEQAANLFVESTGSYNNILIIMGIGLSAIFLLSSLNHFRYALSINNKIVTPTLLFYIVFTFFFLILNSKFIIPTLSLAMDDITNPEAILPGVVSGLVISFARYIYKKYKPNENDEVHSSSYEDTNVVHATTMYSIESMFMMFLIFTTGTMAFIIQNYPEAYFFGLNTKYILSMFLVFFAFSIILNEAIYSKAVLLHVLSFKQTTIEWMMRGLLLIGIFMGLFPETDGWVDITDHMTIIFLTINLLAFFFVARDTKISIRYYKSISQNDLKALQST